MTESLLTHVKQIDQELVQNRLDGLNELNYCTDLSKFYDLMFKGFQLSYVNKHNDTLLHTCKNANVAKYLIDSGLNVDAQNNSGDTPLHLAVGFDELAFYALSNEEIAINNESFSSLDMVKTLLEKGANPNISNNKGETALNRCEDEEIKVLLRSYGATENIVQTPKRKERTRF